MLGVTLVLKNSQCRCMALSVILKTSPHSGPKRYRHLQIIERFQSSKVTASLKDGGPESATETKLEDIPPTNIRNFCIIAHVDHGKSTLADRMLEMTGALAPTPQNKQVLDRLQVERERGITVKAQTASLRYSLCGQEFLLNLIDTPGHIDFSNEVSRSLAACQGVILLVDANQGVQAQTVANFYLAFTQELVIIPVLNKVDLKNANPDTVAQQLKDLFGIEPQEILKISAKFGTGVADLLKAIVERVPPPPTNRDAPLRALLFDCWFDRYRGAVGLLYIVDGSLMVGDEVTWFHSTQNYIVKSLGTLHPHEHPSQALHGGQVGYMTCNMRSTKEAVIGDTLMHKGSLAEALPGFQPARPMVYAGVYPFDQSEHTNLRSALDRLTLNDSAVSIITDSSPALGHGWRLGFLGLLHMEVFNQRLEQEHNVQAIITAPSVTYKVKIMGDKNIKQLGGSVLFISNPTHFPDPNIITEIQEPIVLGTIITPVDYMGDVLSLCMERRGVQTSSRNIDNSRLMLQFLLPLNEILVDFHDSLKSISSGFASFDYEDQGYQESSLVKMNFLLNGIAVDELSIIVHSRKASLTGRRMCRKLLDIIPRQQFQVAIQAKVGSNILARETLKAFRKDVTAKLYGGDVTRKRKLLKRQAEGKARLKSVANISLPRETFIEVLKQ